MKKTIIALMALAGVAVAAETQYVEFGVGGDKSVAAGTTIGSITLNETMYYGNPAAWNAQFGASPEVNITGGGFYAGDYTLSLWVDSSTLSSTGDTLLFAYSGSVSSNSHGYNGIMWNGANKTITMGSGNFTASNMAFVWQDTATSPTLTLGDSTLVNLTFAVTGANKSQTATIYVNGVQAATLDSYNGNMNNGNATTQMLYHLNTNVAYGTIGLTNEKLTTTEQVIAFAAPASASVPEPTTATLSLLALAGLAARRRRK